MSDSEDTDSDDDAGNNPQGPEVTHRLHKRNEKILEEEAANQREADTQERARNFFVPAVTRSRK
jgi:hypothetical protein